MYLFLDTNVWLAIYNDKQYKVADENFIDLKKILDSNKDIKLLLNNVVYNEFWRNRSETVSEGINTLSKTLNSIVNDVKKQKTNFPNFVSYTFGIEETIGSFESKLNKIKDEVIEKAQKFELEADKLINKFFLNEKDILLVDKETVDLANTRSLMGIPPGKLNNDTKNIGDAIIWEWLLKVVPNNEDLYLISFDSDFKNFKNDKNKLSIANNNFSKILEDEWKKKKGSKIFFFDNFNDLNIELEKIKEKNKIEIKNKIDELIKNFGSSRNFRIAHYYAQNLFGMKDYFSQEQMIEIHKHMVSNSQIYLILKDWNISRLLKFVEEYDYNFANKDQEDEFKKNKKKIEVLKKIN